MKVEGKNFNSKQSDYSHSNNFNNSDTSNDYNKSKNSNNSNYLLGGMAGLALSLMSSCSVMFSPVQSANFNTLKTVNSVKAVNINSSHGAGSTTPSTILSIDNRFIEKSIDSSLDSSLLKSVSQLRPKILPMPAEFRIIGPDTVYISDFNYPFYGMDSATVAHNKIVTNNALKIIPRSAPYIKMTIDACIRNSGKFPVPLESMLSLFNAESAFDPFALSGARAWGIAQFTRETAQSFGLDVYSPKEFPKLYELEVKAESLTKRYYSTKNIVYANLKSHNFDVVKKYELIADSILIDLTAARKGFSDEVKRIGVKKIKDDRLIPEKIIPVSVEYVCGIAFKAKRDFHCSDEQAIDWAMEGYNAGPGNLKEDMPFKETYNHERRINKLESKLYPRDFNQDYYDQNYSIYKNIYKKSASKAVPTQLSSEQVPTDNYTKKIDNATKSDSYVKSTQDKLSSSR